MKRRSVLFSTALLLSTGFIASNVSTALAATTNNSSNSVNIVQPLTKAQVGNTSAILAVEQNNMKQALAKLDVQSTLPNIQIISTLHGQAAQSSTIQKSLTQLWESQHQSTLNSTNATSAGTTSGVIQPDSVPIPYGASEVIETYQGDPTLYADQSQTAANYSDAENIFISIVDDAIGLVLKNPVSSVVWDVVTYYGSTLNTNDPVMAQYFHSFKYGYRDVYFWNGSSWVDTYTTTDREWYKHELSSWVDTSNNTRTETEDFNSSPVFVDAGSYWYDSNSQLVSIAENYWVTNSHGWDFYPGY
ncbi:hypothetical protein [Sulfoacidibacillus thermotolerans]|uniref:Uncharacterized protein n=1 Tax=Sulfoacidibacillus thermotolerans TaxID=1765684 RepID=A0A2U3D077_SULT2|nr:hypothetical protein [Sulfoacidibacillus thermotolerans]PWI54701.1 hypothetical protein BM613_13675 [Sulfoacidibacillus thermotolerans]